MTNWNPYHSDALAKQIDLQRAHAWDIDNDIPWHLGVDQSKYLLPLDEDAIAFPECNPQQRLVLSQMMGLIINATISEMEGSLKCVRAEAWEAVLNDYPVNPEMRELGEMFFAEEEKHAQVFQRYLDCFCQSFGIEKQDIELLLPKAFGSNFLKKTVANAKAGGHLFWWVVAQVEEVSIKIFQNIDRDRKSVDPLFHAIHQKHLEEEARHANYAFLMLELIRERELAQGFRLRSLFHRKFDLMAAELWSGSWILSELSKIFDAKNLAGKNDFFATLASALPLVKKNKLAAVVKNLFVQSPYVSLVLNVGSHRKSLRMADRHGALRMPLPSPVPKRTFAEK